MNQLIILGTSNAIPALGHENTHLVLVTPQRKVMIDCGANPILSLQQAGVDVIEITDIILTHMHPDHVGSLPLLLMAMWLMGRQTPLNLHGLEYTLERIKSMMDLYGWSEWPKFFMVCFCPFPAQEKALVFEDEQLCATASPVKHFLPNVCLRFELKKENKSFAYSCDTEPCQAVLNLAEGVDILLHEATGPFPGHSSAAQAGEVARQAGVGSLYLIHYPTGNFAFGDPLSEASQTFSGEIQLAVDLMKIDLLETAEE
ncbi:MAG: MBL fold metallo-hydrolase [Chloroflexota bacterium]